MSFREFSASTRIARPAADVFDWVADYRNVPSVLEGVTRWDPVGEATEGVGAQFDVEMGALGFRLSNRLELDRWQRPRSIGWVSRHGLISQRGAWTFAPRRGGTGVELRIGYEPPGGGLGGFLAGRLEGLVQERLHRALESMRELLEEGA